VRSGPERVYTQWMPIVGEREDEEPEVVSLPPVTRRLLGIARGVNEEEYRSYLEEKYQVKVFRPVRGEGM